jgi:MinD superfamily P-loop ATPase
MSPNSLLGAHDLCRLIDLCEHFNTRISVLINKHNLSAEHSRRIEDLCRSKQIPIVGQLPFSLDVPHALSQARPPLMLSPLTKPLRASWKKVCTLIEG